ncbi:MAG: hypothetical protein NC548_38795 [Lachnospiraceae bacterium]|nr:hypothetical protein [Lachnospiraceae bacterium]
MANIKEINWNGGGSINNSQENKKKFISKFTKQEITEAVFQAVSEWGIEDIILKLYQIKTDRLIDDGDKLIKQLENTVGTLEFYENMKKLDKNQSEMDALSNAFRKAINE